MCLLTLLICVVAVDDPPKAWDPRAAARALDERAAAWHDFKGADRGQGPDKVSCVSCHTLGPYLLARPSLRKTLGEPGPTAMEVKTLDQIRRRVDHWAELEQPRFGLYYDFDEDKKLQSRGTEAVWNALILGRQGVGGEPDETTRRAFDHLWSTQVREGPEAGTWAWLDFGLGPWEAGAGRYFGATLGALAAADAPSASRPDERLDALRAYLRTHREAQDLHNHAWLLLASSRLDGLLTAAERGPIVDRLLAARHLDGGWSLGTLGSYKRGDGTPIPAAPDGYATGLALLALRPAVGADHPAVAGGVRWLRANQRADGSWVGHSVNKARKPETQVGRFMSDAATALAAMALADR